MGEIVAAVVLVVTTVLIVALALWLAL